MALQDILDAIIAQADQQISEARSAHQKKLNDMRAQSEKNLSTKKQDLAVQKEQRKAQMKTKAESHAEALKRNLELQKKRELLDSLYEKTLETLVNVPDEKIEPLLVACLEKISTKGSLHPSAKHEAIVKKIASNGSFTIEEPTKAAGGFMFSSETQEQDFTFEHLVQEWLRPQTELDISHKLF